MNFAEKHSELVATANEVKNFEENDFELQKAKKAEKYTESEYEGLVREALYEKIYGNKRKRDAVKKLIAILLTTEQPSYVALAKQLESLDNSQYHQDLKQIDAMMIARKVFSSPLDLVPYPRDRKRILTTYKEYKEAKQKSSKYSVKFIKKAKKCRCVREILEEAYSIIIMIEREVPLLANSYEWKNFSGFYFGGVEEVLRENMGQIDEVLTDQPLLREYLNSGESRIEFKR